MSGEQLYAMWRTAMQNEGCETDEWEALGDLDRNAWDEVASAVANGQTEVDPVDPDEA